MKCLSVLLASFLCFTTIYGQQAAETRIRKILADQEKAWNVANLEEFMQGYWKSDSMMFVGKPGVTYGWQATLDRYKQRYGTSTETMGKTRFTLLHLKPLSPDTWFVVGRFDMVFVDGKTLFGHFTLLFKKIDGDWKIICDHSS